MQWDAIGAVGEVVGAIGVILTLFYLAGQIRQNTKTISAQMVQSIGENTQKITLAPIEQLELAQALHLARRGEETSPLQRELIGRYLFSMLRNWELNLYAKRRGFHDPSMQESHEQGLRSVLTQDFGARWWDSNKAALFSSTFVQEIDAILSAKR